MGTALNKHADILLACCVAVSLYYTSDILRISWHRETAREKAVLELHCKQYGKYINNWAMERNQEPPCK